MDDSRTDEALLSAFAEGELAAFGVLYARHAPALLRLGTVRLAHREWLGQAFREAWMPLTHGLSRVQAGVPLRLQLLRWMREALFEQVRQHQHEIPFDPAAGQGRNALDLMLDGAVDGSVVPTADDACQQRFWQLPGEQRECLVLHLCDDLSVPDLAQVFGQPRVAVQAALDLALQALGAPDLAPTKASLTALPSTPLAPSVAAAVQRAMRFALAQPVARKTPAAPAPASRAWLWQLPLALIGVAALGAGVAWLATRSPATTENADLNAIAGAGLAGEASANARGTAVGARSADAEASRQSVKLGPQSEGESSGGKLVREADIIEQGAKAGAASAGGSRAGTKASVQVGAALSAQAWLDLIEDLLRAGEVAEARAEWARFRAAYPKFAVKRELAEKLEKQ